MATIYDLKPGDLILADRTIAIDSNIKSRISGKFLFNKGLIISCVIVFGLHTAANKALAQTACTGTPAPGNTVASVNPVCTGGSTTLSLQNSSSGTGIIYNWQSSTDGTNYTNIGPYIMNNATFANTPANMTVYGNAAVTSGTLQLTNTSTGGQIGGAVISTTPGSNITPFTAVFDYRIWDGTGADGLSLSYASNIANDAGTGETGEGSGIILMLDTYDNTGNVTNSQIRINYNGVQVYANALGAFELRTNLYRTVRLSVDGSGYLSLSIGSTSIVSNLLLTGYATADKTNWKFKFSGRTGSKTDTHSIDGLTILMGNNSTISQSLSVSTYFKCLVTCASSISNATSTTLQVVASPASVGGTANATSAIITTGTGGSVYLSGYTGSIQWQQSADNSSWGNVIGGSGANNETYLTPNLTSKTYYRAVVSSGPCSSATSSATSISVAPAAPTSVTATPSTITIGSSSNLNATSTGNTINWYDAATGGTLLTTVSSGTNYSVSPTVNTTYYAEAQAAGSNTDLTLTSTNDYGADGVYFNLTTLSGATTVDGFTFKPNSGGVKTISVYYKSGTYSGFESNSASWILLGTYSSDGVSGTSFVDIANLTIPSSTTYGFYLFSSGSAFQVKNGTATASDSKLSINGGSLSYGAFTNINTGYAFTGGARYITEAGLSSLSRTSVIVTVNPAAPTAVTATPSAIYNGTYTNLNATSTGNKINWYETNSGGTAFSTVNSGENTATFPTTDMTYYAEAMIPASTANVTLTNSSNLTPYGVFFDVTSKPGAGAIIVDGFPMYGTYPNGHQFQVYYKTGTYAGSETNSAAWTYYGSFTRSNGDYAAFIDITDLTIPANTTYGFYLFYGTWNDLNSSNSASSSSDANVTISGGSVHTGASLWSTVTTGSFRGGVRYVTVPARLSSTRTPVSVTVTQTPATQATSVTFNSVQTTQMGISWTNGDGSNRAVFVIEGSSGTVSLNNGTSYPADPVYVVSGFSPNWQCVYNGTGTSVTVTGLKAATIYRVHVCEYNGTEGNQAYNITSATGNPASQQTAFSEITWDGSESTDWFEPLNWTPETYPDVTTNLTIPNTSVKPLISDGSGPPMTATCNNITIQTGAVLTIGATGKLTVNGTLTNNAGAAGIVVNSGGSLIEHSGANATVKRAIAENEWHLISAPVSTAKAGMFSGFYLQKHTELTNAYTDITDIGEDLIPVQGYALYGSAGVSPAVFSGALNAGEKSFITSLSASPGEGWNLIGNPYPSSIDWNSMYIVKSGIASATYCHVSSTEGAENEGWATYINGTGTNGGTQYIAPCQGFFVQANAETGSVTMNNGARLHNATTFFKNTKIVPNLIRLEVSGNGYRDEAVVRFVPEATADFDGNYDARKLFGEVAAAAQVYTAGTGQLSINSLPETNMVPVGVKIGSTGSYTIAATEINDMPYATLEDTKTGIFAELAKDPYTFNFTLGEDEMRFKLHFSALSVNEDEASDISIYSYHKTAYINLKNQLKGDIYIYNMAGQLITSQETACGLVSLGINAPGIYIVKVVSDKGTTTAKIFIQ